MNIYPEGILKFGTEREIKLYNDTVKVCPCETCWRNLIFGLDKNCNYCRSIITFDSDQELKDYQDGKMCERCSFNMEQDLK